MEAKEGSIRAALPWNLPIDQGAFQPPWTPDSPEGPTLRGLDTRHRIRRWITPEGSAPGDGQHTG